MGRHDEWHPADGYLGQEAWNLQYRSHRTRAAADTIGPAAPRQPLECGAGTAGAHDRLLNDFSDRHSPRSERVVVDGHEPMAAVIGDDHGQMLSHRHVRKACWGRDRGDDLPALPDHRNEVGTGSVVVGRNDQVFSVWGDHRSDPLVVGVRQGRTADSKWFEVYSAEPLLLTAIAIHIRRHQSPYRCGLLSPARSRVVILW